MLIVGGLYIATLIRLAVSEDWGDSTASRLFALTLCAASLLWLISIGQEMGVATGPRNRRTTRRKVVALLVAAVVPVGFITSMIRTGTVFGDPLGQWIAQTAMIGIMLIFITDKPSRERL